MKTFFRGHVLLWMIAIILVASGGIFLLITQTERFQADFRRIEGDKQAVEQASQDLEKQIESIKGEREKLTKNTMSLEADRNNLLAQAKRLIEQSNELSWITDLHQHVLKQAADENRALRSELYPLERQYDEIKKLHSELIKVHTELQRQLSEERERAQEDQLQLALIEEQEKVDSLAGELQQVKRELTQLQSKDAKTEKKLSGTKNRLDKLMDDYTEVLSKNKVMNYRIKNLPKDVTRIARQHEQLVEEVADTHYNLGVLFTQRDDYIRAIKEFRKVVELKPNDGDAYYNLGLIYAEHVPDRQKALQHFRRYLEINPDADDAGWVKQYIVSWRAWEAEDPLE
jgi:chromosome segregation ATPase